MTQPRLSSCLIYLFVIGLWAIHPLLGSEKSKIKILPVPIVRQSTPYSCGAAAAQAVLNYWKTNHEGELALHEPLQTDKEHGTHPSSIVRLVKSLGLKVDIKTYTRISEVEAAIDRNEPVIVDYQAWGGVENRDYSNIWDSGHYGVIVGYDETHFYFMDPILSSSYGKIDKLDFQKRWHDVETRNGKIEYFIQTAIFISGLEKLTTFPAEIQTID